MKSARIKNQLVDFYGVEREMTRSDAYRSLSLVAFRLFHEMMDMHDGSNNGRIGMTTVQAMEFARCSKPTALGAMRELRERGLVIRTHKADRTAPGARIEGDHSTYLLTCHPYRDLQGSIVDPTRQYRLWSPGVSLEHLEDALEARPEKAAGVARADAARPKRTPVATVRPPVDTSWCEGVAF